MEKYDYDWYFGMPNYQNRERLKNFVEFISPKCNRVELKRIEKFISLIDLIPDFDLSYCFPKFSEGILALEWYLIQKSYYSFSLSIYVSDKPLSSYFRGDSGNISSDPRNAYLPNFRDLSTAEVAIAFDFRYETSYGNKRRKYPLGVPISSYTTPSKFYGVWKFKLPDLGSRKVKDEIRKLVKQRVNLLHKNYVEEN